MADSYRMIKLLGEGSFGKCYLVEAQSDRSLCVIKQIDIRIMSPQEKEETIREALILRSFEHPNIITFRDAYTTKKGKLCIVMDFADGGDLQSKIKQQRGILFPENQILDWFVQICLALKHVHDRKILHRDLKTQNVFLTNKGRVKLGDFGIAKVLNTTSDNARTMVGTPYYLSPEIIENRPYNFKSDIWSLGIMMYEMCCLKPPFDASSLHFLALKIVRGVFPPIPGVFSKDIRSLIARMLATDPNRRPTIHSILKEPIIRNRIHNFLETSIRAAEFSHTILHNENIFSENKRVQPSQSRPKNTWQEGDPDIEATEINPKKRREETKKVVIEEEETKVPKESWSEEHPSRKKNKKRDENERKKALEDIREKKAALNEQRKRSKSRRTESEEQEEEERDEEAMIYEMGEAMLEKEGEELEYSEVEAPKDIPPDRDDEFGEDEEPEEIERLPTVDQSHSYDKIEALRIYLEENIGTDVLLEAYRVVEQLESEEDISYEHYFPYLQNIMSMEVELEYLPLIQALIDMENQELINLV